MIRRFSGRDEAAVEGHDDDDDDDGIVDAPLADVDVDPSCPACRSCLISASFVWNVVSSRRDRVGDAFRRLLPAAATDVDAAADPADFMMAD